MDSITIIDNRINRVKAQIFHLDNNDLFSEKDKEPLRERYTQQLEFLENERHKVTNDIEVEAEIVGVDEPEVQDQPDQ